MEVARGELKIFHLQVVLRCARIFAVENPDGEVKQNAIRSDLCKLAAFNFTSALHTPPIILMKRRNKN
jgi:hypothetical protein